MFKTISVAEFEEAFKKVLKEKLQKWHQDMLLTVDVVFDLIGRLANALGQVYPTSYHLQPMTVHEFKCTVAEAYGVSLIL